MEEQTAKKSLLITSISPYKIFIEKIVYDFADVKTIVPENQNPHFFNPSIKQVSQFGNAKAFFRIGEAFEDKILPSLLDKNSKMVIVDLQNKIDLIPIEKCEGNTCSHGYTDVHLWLSPKIVIKQLLEIQKSLVTLFPMNKKNILERVRELQNELRTLDATLEKLSLRDKAFLTSHKAFAYFCRDYDCIEIPIEMGQKEASAKYLETLIRKAKEKDIQLMVIIPHINDQGAKRLSDNLSIKSIVFDPYAKDYFGNLTFLGENIQRSHE